jgi:hypothetical protein
VLGSKPTGEDEGGGGGERGVGGGGGGEVEGAEGGVEVDGGDAGDDVRVVDVGGGDVHAARGVRRRARRARELQDARHVLQPRLAPPEHVVPRGRVVAAQPRRQAALPGHPPVQVLVRQQRVRHGIVEAVPHRVPSLVPQHQIPRVHQTAHARLHAWSPHNLSEG